MPQTKAITLSLDGEIELAAFRPVAYYDKPMDCIRVLTHDRSVTEHHINEFLTLCEANHRSALDPKYVGFVINGVKQLFGEIGLPLDMTHKLAVVIDKLASHRPGSIRSETIKLVFSQVSPGDLSIELQGTPFPA